MRRGIRFLFVVLSLLSFPFFSPFAYALSWDVHVVEAQPNPCWTTLAVGEWGTAVLYADGVSTGLRLAWGGPDAWEYESLAPAGASGSWVRCCTLEGGELFAAWYHTPLGHSLMTAVGRPGEEWNVISKEFLGEMQNQNEMGLAMAVDLSGIPWVTVITRDTRYPNKGLLKILFPTLSTLSANRFIDEDDSAKYSVGASCDVVVDENGSRHFAYFRTDKMDIKYKKQPKGGTLWPMLRVATGFEVLEGISLLPAPNGALIAFFKRSNGDVSKMNLCFRVFSNDSWSAPLVLDAGADTGGFATSLRDSHGKTYVFYSGGTEGGVRLLTDRTGAWEIHVVDPDSILGSRCAAAFSGDAVLVSYWDAFSRSVKLLRVGNTPPSTPWGPDPVDGSEPESAPMVFSWAPCSDDENDGVTYSVYASDARWKIEALEEDALVLSGEARLSADVPEALRAFSPVYWRVVATDSYGSSREGATWSYEVLPSPTPTSEPSSTPTPIPSPPASPTPATTNTPTPAVLPSATPTEAPAPTSTPTSTPMPIVSPGVSPTPVLSPSAIPTPVVTHTPTPAIVPSATPTEAPTPTSTPTSTPIPIVSPSVSPTPIPSPAASPTPATTNTPTPAVLPSAAPTEAPTPIVSPVITLTPVPLPTESPTPVVTHTPTPAIVPSATPTGIPSPTPEPDVTPTSVPTPTHGAGPTSNPGPSPSRPPTPTSSVPSPVAGKAESNAGCDATGGSLVVLVLLAPLFLGPLDRK